MWTSFVGGGFSSPIVVANRIFVSADPSKIVCVNLKDGTIRWKASLRAADVPEGSKANAAESFNAPTSCGFAAPTPVSDGKNVYFVFGTGLVGCYSIDGDRKWVQYLPPAGQTYGHSASPLLIEGKLLVNLNHLAALDAASGKIVWECREVEHSYGTPAQMQVKGVPLVVTPLGKIVRVSDGHLLAKGIAPDLGGSEYGISPIASGDTAYLGDRTLTAVRLSAAGDAITTKIVWSVSLDVSAYASPVIVNGMLFFVGKEAECFVIDLVTGKTLHDEELKIGHQGVDDPVLSGASIFPSLVVAGDKLLVSNDRGQTFIYEASKDLKVIAQNRLTEGSGATPVIVGSSIVLRSGDSLWRIGK